MTETSTDGQWYIARDGKQHGPLSDDEMRLFVDGGHLRPSDLVWRPGFTDWRPAPAIFPPASVPKPAAAATPTNDGAGNTQQPDTSKTPTHQPSSSRAATSSETSSRPATSGKPAPSAATHPSRSRTPAQRPVGPQNTQAREHAYPQQQDEQRSDAATAQHAAPVHEQQGGGWGRKLAVAALIGVIATGGWFAYQLRNHIGDLANAASNLTKQPLTSRSSEKKVAALDTTQAPGTDQKTRVDSTKRDGGEIAFDPRRSGSPLWKLLSREFPDWYADRVEEAETLVDKEPNTEITKRHIRALVELRRKHVESALAASNANLVAIAATFLANLQSLSDHSTDACYHYITRGEGHPNILELTQDPAHATPIETQITAVFQAIATGRSQPKSREAPNQADYGELVRQLGTLGWSDADVKLFGNPREFAKAPPARACRMVKDFFTAHLKLTDSSSQDRLLHSMLRIVIAG